MSEYLNDHDRVEMLKKWWDRNGTALIIGIVVGLAIIYGLQYFHKFTTDKSLAASNAYQNLLAIQDKTENSDFEKQATAIVKKYPRSPYAELSSFVLAQAQVQQKNYEAAFNTLNWVIRNGVDSTMRQIARIRAARLLLTMQKPQAALTLLEKEDNKHFAILTNEVRGDIYVVQKNYAAAKAAYTAALNGNPDSPVLLPVLQLKLSSLPNS